jgi:periplasmic protein TonB
MIAEELGSSTAFVLARQQEWVVSTGSGLRNAFVLSLIVHAAILFGLAFQQFMPPPPSNMEQMEVVLVNSKSNDAPSHPTLRAQNDLNGGGNTDEDHSLSSPLAAMDDDLAKQASDAEKNVARLEREAAELMMQIKAKQALESQKAQNKSARNNPQDYLYHPLVPDLNAEASKTLPGVDPTQNGQAFSREAAEISKRFDAYQKRPRRKELGGRAIAYVFAQYEDAYRTKIEKVGTLNYPPPRNGEPVYGKVRITASVRSDGTVEKIVVNTSSGDSELDQAAVNIVYMSSPFGPFTPKMHRQADVLDITRTFNFTRQTEELHAEAP